MGNWINTTADKLNFLPKDGTYIEWSHDGINLHGKEEIIGYPTTVKARYYRITKNGDDNMAKEQVTLEEKKALDIFKGDVDYNGSLEFAIKYYIQNNMGWTNTYIPLRKMGFEKFVRCLVNGYEVEFDDSLKYKVNCEMGESLFVMYNAAKKFLKDTECPIYITASSNRFALSIEDTNNLIKYLQSLLQQLDMLNNN